jgi:hypothetical protein
MNGQLTPAPRVEALEAVQRRRASDAKHDTAAASHSSTCAPPGIPQRNCARLVMWLRCHACQSSYFTAGAPDPQPSLHWWLVAVRGAVGSGARGRAGRDAAT